jgi:glycosyltransferase involved in cell wall biosynthesis
MPTVILEAMARGKAIIATDVGAVAELVDESNGFIIPPNDVAILRKAINHIKVSQVKKFGSSSTSKVKNYTWKILSEKLLIDFERIL